MAFDPVDPRQPLPDMEQGILQYWREEDVFKRSLRQRHKESSDPWDNQEKNENGDKDIEAEPKGQTQKYSFYDGPPFATGLPHYGHLLAGTIKDVIPRYQTMRGHYVERRFGWDCHGLPIENIIEQEHDITDKKQIEEMGIDKFNALCREAVQRYTEDWRTVVERMGRWVDMDWDYRTMDPDYMESMWWAFKELHKKNLIYEGYKPMHICPRCVTPLSNFEVTQAYSDRTDMSVIMTFPLKDDPNTVLLAWTTTSWSLPGNFWLAVSDHVTYVRVKESGSDTEYVCAEKLVPALFKDREHQVVGPIEAKELVGQSYEPLFPYFVDTVIPSTEAKGKPETYGDRVFKVVMYDDVEVSDEDGTGIVHITSCLGEDSFAVAKNEGVDIQHHLGMDGEFFPEVTDFAGMKAKPDGEDPMATDKAIIAKIKENGRHFSSYTYAHSYPHCWRCDTPLLNYATSSWFVAVEEIKKKMLKNKDKTAWVPSHIKDGRYGKWIEGARDWAISRNRYWGTPLPIWRSSESGDIEVIGSREELMHKAPERFTKVTVVRHGESEGNLIPIYQGIAPGTDLTAAGQGQAEKAAKWIADCNHVYASPLARTQQTAAAIAKEAKAEVTTDERIQETQFGDYEGKTVDFSDLSMIKARRAHKLETNQPESIYHFPGMETWESTKGRVTEFLQDVLPKHKGEHIVVVTHADPANSAKHFFTGIDPFKISHQPYPKYAEPQVYYWDHNHGEQMDLHKDRVDNITWTGKDGGTFERIPEVLDCWFESGSMPYSQCHYPFDFHSGKLPDGFPANFIAEGVDQTRAWFYVLMVLSTALFDDTPFENVVVNGTVLAEDGKKMSKKLKNYPDPMEIVGKYGADAIRFTLMSSPAVRAEDLRMSEKLVEESLRSVLLPLWNTYSFFVTYANAAGFEPVQTRRHSNHPLDQWILAEVQDLVNRMTEQLDRYDLSATCGELHETIDALTNWYVRLSRRRFAGKAETGAEEDQLDALHTLYDVLLTLSQLLAPFCPYITDAIYLNLVAEDHGSIHLTDWPQTRDLSAEENTLLEKTRLQRLITSLGLSVRGEHKVKVRQPLASATVAVPPKWKDVVFSPEDMDVLKAELNIKGLTFSTDPGALAEAYAQVDARKVGPRLGGDVQKVIQAGKEGNFTEQEDGTVKILDEVLQPDEVHIAYRGAEGQEDQAVAADRGVVVSLDIQVTEELELEGHARDLIRTVQRLRKESGLEFTDKIRLHVQGLDALLEQHGDLVAQETNAAFAENDGETHTVEIGEDTVQIQFAV